MAMKFGIEMDKWEDLDQLNERDQFHMTKSVVQALKDIGSDKVLTAVKKAGGPLASLAGDKNPQQFYNMWHKFGRDSEMVNPEILGEILEALHRSPREAAYVPLFRTGPDGNSYEQWMVGYSENVLAKMKNRENRAAAQAEREAQQTHAERILRERGESAEIDNTVKQIVKIMPLQDGSAGKFKEGELEGREVVYLGIANNVRLSRKGISLTGEDAITKIAQMVSDHEGLELVQQVDRHGRRHDIVTQNEGGKRNGKVNTWVLAVGVRDGADRAVFDQLKEQLAEKLERVSGQGR